MNRSQKFVFFIFALVTMALLASASIVIAQNQRHWGYGLLLMVLACVVTGLGFVVRRRVLKTIHNTGPIR